MRDTENFDTSDWSLFLKDKIELVEYDPSWKEKFQQEKRSIEAAMPEGLLLKVEHFGSTSIKGIKSKPVIDILIAVGDLSQTETISQALIRLGYVQFTGEMEDDHFLFVKGMPPFGKKRTHHIHIHSLANPVWDALYFRDYINQHERLKKEYEQLKLDLAEKYPHDRLLYTQGKKEFQDKITDQAKEFFNNHE